MRGDLIISSMSNGKCFGSNHNRNLNALEMLRDFRGSKLLKLKLLTFYNQFYCFYVKIFHKKIAYPSNVIKINTINRYFIEISIFTSRFKQNPATTKCLTLDYQSVNINQSTKR